MSLRSLLSFVPLFAAALLGCTTPEEHPHVMTVVISPSSVTLAPGATQQFSAAVTGHDNQAVFWSIKEGPSGGGITSAGLYTAPATAGTFTVVATSQDDASQSGQASVTVAAASGISVSLDPAWANLNVGATQSFTATVTGTSNTQVTWSLEPASGSGTLVANGNTAAYTAPGTPGSFKVIATSAADSTQKAVAELNVSPAASPSVSGTVFYAGAKSGRVYVTVQDENSGTSIPAPGAFTVHGLFWNGSKRLFVFLDALENGQYDYAADPSAEVNFNFTGTDVSGVNVTLGEPPSLGAPPQASAPFAVPGADSALVIFESVRNGNGQELATGYKLYWSTTPNPGPGNQAAGGPLLLPSGEMGAAYLSHTRLSAGGTYYFALGAVNGSAEGPLSPSSAGVTIAAPTGGTTVSGTLSFAGLSLTGPLIVGVYSESAGVYFVRVTGTTSPQSFTIPGVPPGEYQMFATADQNDDGAIGIYEPSTGFAEQGPSVSVGSAAVTGLEATLLADAALARVTTSHFDGAGGEQYGLQFRASGNSKRIVKAQVVAAMTVGAPLDVGLERWGSGRFRVFAPLGGVAPSLGESFKLQLAFADGTTQLLSPQVTGLVNAFPTLVAPVNQTVSTATPTFSWTLPSSVPASYSLRLRVEGNYGSQWEIDLPAGTTSVDYNVDGKGAALSPGSYNWSLSLYDEQGNSSERRADFTVP